MCEAGKHGKFANIMRGFGNVSHSFPQMHLGLLLKRDTGKRFWQLMMKQTLCHFTIHKVMVAINDLK